MSDTRRFRSSEELANAVFGSVPLSDEQRRQKEAEHKAAQVPKPPAPEPPKPKGWTPPGYRSDATANLAFREKPFAPLAWYHGDQRTQRQIDAVMRGAIHSARGQR